MSRTHPQYKVAVKAKYRLSELAVVGRATGDFVMKPPVYFVLMFYL
jgi:hypothetical protein